MGGKERERVPVSRISLTIVGYRSNSLAVHFAYLVSILKKNTKRCMQYLFTTF